MRNSIPSLQVFSTATSAACEAVWLRQIFRDIQDDNKEPTIIGI